MTKPASFLKSKSSFIPEITGSSPPSFLKKTYEILENPVYSDIMSWNDDGKAIIIKDISELVDKVLPIFFKHKNFTSYVRQLNLYGFRKVKGSSHFQAYFHPMFQRGKKDLLARMKRKNNDNLLIFKPHLMDSMQDDEEPRLKAEHSASLSQEPQAHEDADLAESENLQAKKVQKELNERINMVENQLKQFTEQNRILVNIIQKRDLELDSLIRRCIPACSTKDAELHPQSQDFSHQISIPQPLVSSNAIVMSNPVLLHKMQTRNMQIIPTGQSNQNVERSNSNMKSDEGTYRTRLSQKNTKETNEGGTPKNFSSKFASSEGSFKSATEKRANKTEEF